MQIMQPMRLKPQRCPKNLDDVLITSTMSQKPRRCPKNLTGDLIRTMLHVLPHFNGNFLLFNATSERFVAPTAKSCKLSATM